ncbi:hypothetical protein Gogos_021069, partial [Gossypium gossypioides]|nr:hypothetical protein [Gossypium gossypioides]
MHAEKRVRVDSSDVRSLLVWFHSHFWKVDRVSYQVFSENYSPLKEIDIEWRAPWLLPDEILYRYGGFDWVPLLGIWGAGIVECEFSYKGNGYKKNIREMSNAWNQTRRMKRLAVGLMTTPEYNKWWVRRINDNIPKSSQGDSQLIEEHLRVVPSELEIIRQDFERRNAELEKRI